MNTKKLVPLLIVLLGLALVIAAFVVWLEPPAEGGVFSVAGGIISFLAGLGTSIKGWKDLLKKDEGEKALKPKVKVKQLTSALLLPLPNYQLRINNYSKTPSHSKASSLDATKNVKSSNQPFLQSPVLGEH